MKVLGIVGSRRKHGNTFNIVNEVLKSVEKNGADIQLIYLGDYKIKPCTGCEGCKDSFKCVINDDFNKIISLIQDADGVVMGSPTYWYNVSGDMKIFIDRCYSLILYPDDDRTMWVSEFEDQGKWGIPIAVCEQHDESMMGYTYETLNKVMTDLHIRVSKGIKGFGYFEADKAIQDEKIVSEAKIVGIRLVKALELKTKGKNIVQENLSTNK